MLTVPLACIAAFHSRNVRVVHSVYTHLTRVKREVTLSRYEIACSISSFNWKSISACNKDKTFTVQCIFMTKNGFITPAPNPFKNIFSVMFSNYVC